MRHTRFLMLLTLILACAGLTVWVLGLALASGRLDQSLLFSLTPLVMVAALAVQTIRKGNDR